MTYFLPPFQPNATPTPPQPDLTTTAATSFWGGVSAVFDKTQLEINANFHHQNTQQRVRDQTEKDVLKVLGLDGVKKAATDAGVPVSMPSFPGGYTPPDPYGDTMMKNPKVWDAAIAVAQEDAKTNPKKWEGVSLSPEQMKAETEKRLQAEYKTAQETISMMPESSLTTELLGSLSAYMADVKTLPFLAVGGVGGSLLRTIGREAAINTVIEGVNLPSEFEMAKVLQIEKPSISKNLTYAAIGGAGFAVGAKVVGLGVKGAVKVLSPTQRGLEYGKGRNVVKSIDAPAPVAEALVNKAEDAIVGDVPNPLEDVKKVVEQNPVNPINPERTPLIPKVKVPDPVESPAKAPDPAKEPTKDEIVAQAEADFTKQYPEMSVKHPLAKVIMGLGGVKYKHKVDGHMVLTPVAKGLKAMGVTHKTHPFIWRKKGRRDLDAIPADEHPGLAQTIGTDGAGYLHPERLTEALGEELSSGRKTALSPEIAVAIDELDALTEHANMPEGPAKDFVSGKKADSGLFINPDMYAFDVTMTEADQRISADVTDWMKETGYYDTLTEAERSEIIKELQTTGGDAEYLVERALEREVDYGEIPPTQATDGDVPFFGDQPSEKGVLGQGAKDSGNAGPDTKSKTGSPTGSGDNSGPLSEQISSPLEGITLLQIKNWIKQYSGNIEAAKLRHEEIKTLIGSIHDNFNLTYLEKVHRFGLLFRQQFIIDQIARPKRKLALPRKGKLSFAKNIADWEKTLITDVLSEFGFDRKLKILRVQDDPLTASRGSIAGVLNRNGFFDVNLILALPRTPIKTAKNFESILHEIGHIIEVHAVHSDHKMMANLLYDWINSLDLKLDGVDNLLKNSGIGFRKESAAADLRNAGREPRASDADYYKFVKNGDSITAGFPEWFAEQTAKFLEGDKSTHGVVDKFFARVAAMWRKLINRMIDEGRVAKSITQVYEDLRTRGHYEQTAAGDQTLIKGVAPITPKDRLQSAQSAPMQGGTAPLDDGLFDVTGRSQMDMFSDPASAEAKVAHDSMMADIQQSIEASGDFETGKMQDVNGQMSWAGLTDMDGNPLRTASEALDYINQGQEFSDVIDLCGRPK